MSRIKEFNRDPNVGEYLTIPMFRAYHDDPEWERFRTFMDGQTMTIIDGKTAIYRHDYERWLRDGRKDRQGADWD